MINAALLAAVRGHAAACYPQECCGLIVGEGDSLCYHPCRNSDLFPARQFTVDPLDWVAAEERGVIRAVCHSHPNRAPQPSAADKLGCEQSGLPWVIVSVPGDAWTVLTPSGFCAPLLGRDFVWGVFDCFTLVRDYYREVVGITLPDAEPYSYNFWKNGEALYEQRLEAFGFIRHGQGEELRAHDVLLIPIRSTIANHAAIYLGDGQIVHHLEGQLSRRDLYGGFWQKNTRFIARHNALC
ncbi:MAG: C40 family peptidase [Methylovulum sp.]|nr:C40 family peptidase [Methylovulum sp.]